MCLSALGHMDTHINSSVSQNRPVQIKLEMRRAMNQHIPQKKVNKQIAEK